ncbi:DUF1080 domain-containing protein [Flavimarina sp. Hel_I_48]|uniref:3-keto-disaccharide hydrolase n=1 Tax=Flavimarina sp. Hel_I_48 TaxID=1392488 RepID=UPI000691B97F|nr:DUF1080 domain-containing protein [Flavimarina sp. Hel_I_48]
MTITNRILPLFTLFCLFLTDFEAKAQDSNPLEGRWDLVMKKDGKEMPSWLEVKHSGNNTLVGRFVYAFGSARPIAEVKSDGNNFTFSIPPQWEPEGQDMEFEGRITGDQLEGSMIYTDGSKAIWTGSRAPTLKYNPNPTWGEPQNLLNTNNLDGWHTKGENQWVVENGILKSPKSGSNLISDEEFMNFKLHIEFRYPEGSNSGIYLRGRYEVQITDSYGKQPSDIEFSAVYGFLPPTVMAAHPAGEWQACDITLIGNRVSIIANGIPVITDQIIPGITGGALDSEEAKSGPFMLQGDHGVIEFRNIIVTPIQE